MKLNHFLVLGASALLVACGPKAEEKAAETAHPSDDWDAMEVVDKSADVVTDEEGFAWQTEQFGDIRMVRYQIPGWEKLEPRQKELVYYLTQAGYAGRDMMYDQNYRHNLEIRNTLENIYTGYTGDKSTIGWDRFETYLKRIWFSNGIHHHYSNAKHAPGFDEAYFDELLAAVNGSIGDEARKAIFDPEFDNKKVELDEEIGLVEGSAINFYAPDVTTDEAKAYLASVKDTVTRSPISYKLNLRLAKNEAGEIIEEVYKVGGKYGAALEEVCSWLKKAETVAENDKQAAAFRNLVKYYETGDLKTWDIYNLNWIQDTDGDIDYINGFIEVYNDPLGFTGSYETIVQIKDFDASQRMAVLMDNAQWFEDNSPIMDEHKKAEVKGVTYNVVNVAGEAGDASPSTPIGVNLPNAPWIRLRGSKSVSLGNILAGYDNASGSGMLAEFVHDEEELQRSEAWGNLAGDLHTAMHEVIGHASGQIEDGVGTPKETIENYASTIEEGRADLVALYYLLDPKLVELGLMESLEVGKAEYDGYIRNGQLAQLRRLELGEDIQEAHMRNRAWVSGWVLEKGGEEVISKVERDGKTYYEINDYDALRVLFGELLREVQRITSTGDLPAAKLLVDTYGVKVDQATHKQVLDRTANLGTNPYGGFINPLLVPETDADGNITNVNVTYPDDFAKQMLFYSETFSFLK